MPMPAAQVKQNGAAGADSRRCAATHVPREVVAGRRAVLARNGHDAGAALHAGDEPGYNCMCAPRVIPS